MSKKEIICIVDWINLEGPHGPYVRLVARKKDGGIFTIGFNAERWLNGILPREEGEIVVVIVYEALRKRNFWKILRPGYGRKLTPEDDQIFKGPMKELKIVNLGGVG